MMRQNLQMYPTFHDNRCRIKDNQGGQHKWHGHMDDETLVWIDQSAKQ